LANLNFHILRYDSVPSTNTEAVEQAKRGAPEGTCVVASEQTAGRGRHGRVWASPKCAGLYFSLVLRPRIAPAEFPLLTFVAALAVQGALREESNLITDIKWSNDVLVGERKLCGILAERIETIAGACVILGVGVNLRRESYPPEVAARATSIETETSAIPDAESLLRTLLEHVRRRYIALHDERGAALLLADYTANSSYATGKHVRVESGGEAFDGTTRGLAADGALRVELPDGEIRIVHAGDVTVVRARERAESCARRDVFGKEINEK